MKLIINQCPRCGHKHQGVEFTATKFRSAEVDLIGECPQTGLPITTNYESIIYTLPISNATVVGIVTSMQEYQRNGAYFFIDGKPHWANPGETVTVCGLLIGDAPITAPPAQESDICMDCLPY